MQHPEKRRNVRRTIRYPASIELDGGRGPIRCTLRDASQEGAQLQVDAPAELPGEFTLVLGYDGTALRRCRVAWRSETEVGVEFIKLPRSSPRPSFRPPEPESEPEAPAALDIESLSSR